MVRRERGRGGHEFSHEDLRVFWLAENHYVIVNHRTDKSWQLWWKHPDHGWFLQSWHPTLAEAKEEAEKPRIADLPVKNLRPGTYVCALHEPAGRPIMVRCSSDYTASEIFEIFDELGYQTSLKTVV